MCLLGSRRHADMRLDWQIERLVESCTVRVCAADEVLCLLCVLSHSLVACAANRIFVK